MSRLHATLVERARAVRIEDEIAYRGVELRRQGGELIGPCPTCGGVDRFGINLAKQVFNCRGCGARGGDAIALVQSLDRCTFVAAVETLAGTSQAQRANGYSVGSTANLQSPEIDDATSIHSVLRWWHTARRIEGTLGISYLQEERRIVGLPP